MKFENTEIFNFSGAIRGMRNPKESWHLSDSTFDPNGTPHIGPNDMRLAQTLIRGGSEHRKFMRQILVSVDITAPLYWWKEFDTYKVGTTANSTSTMHKLMSKPITHECFEEDDYDENVFIIKQDQSNTTDLGKMAGFIAHWHVGEFADYIIDHCEEMRQMYIKLYEQFKNETDPLLKKIAEEKAYLVWKELVRWLPEGWLQTRTVTMTYENLFNMCSKSQRRPHRLNEWSGRRHPELKNFIAWARTLPYAQEFIFIDELDKKNEEA